ncbi:hypothetical protein ACFXPS_10455 [Nocardia sp. NPDC059091]|uniref:hypothetical protein n=1 Tax=unclassified Nocardia TaxID=2637762 RepID=UPI0036912855
MSTRFGVIPRIAGFLLVLAVVFGAAWAVGTWTAPGHSGPPAPTTTARHGHSH